MPDNKKIIIFAILACLIIDSVGAVLPVIARNINDPDLIVYFDADEGHLMDCLWHYYSGEKRPSFIYESDYGVGMLYLAYIARLVPRGIFAFKPGTFVLILRWLTLIFWIASLIALYRLVRRHFGGYGEALAIALLVAVRPAFPCLIQNSKPDIIVLFFVLLGLDYTLRMITRPSAATLAAATACASAAFMIKFAGIFLLPAVILAAFYAKEYGVGASKIFRASPAPWIFPAVSALPFIIFPAAMIFLYKRFETGLTWYQEYGLWQSLARNRLIIWCAVVGMLLLLLSAVLAALNARKSAPGKMRIFNSVLSSSMVVLAVFTAFTAVFGSVWLVRPAHFIHTFATTGREAFGYGTPALSEMLREFINKVKGFDPAVLALFLIAACRQVYSLAMGRFGKDRALFFKRMVLLVFVLSCAPCIFAGVRFNYQHMLPFFAASAVYAAQYFKELYAEPDVRRFFRNAWVAFAAIFVIADVTANVALSAKAFSGIYRYKGDVVFEMADWLKARYPADTAIAAGHPTNTYVPPFFGNVKFLKYQRNNADGLRDLVKGFRPKVVFYNAVYTQSGKMPPLEDILPGTKMRLAASFDNARMSFQRYPNARFLVYELSY